MDTIQQILTKYGFGKSTAKIYELLVKNGESSVSDLIDKSELSRGGIYDALSSLQEKNLVKHRKKGRKALYKAENPDKLHYLKEEKENEVNRMNAQLESIIHQLKGEYSLTESKPGARFFEGKKGFKEALWDTLEAEEIYTIADVESVQKYVPEINEEYVKTRRKKSIDKKILITNTEASRNYMKKQGEELTDTRLLPENMDPFRTGVEIYDNKVSFFTLREENITATIIEDPDIHKMQKSMFEFLWNLQKSRDLEEGESLQEKMKEDLQD